MTRGPDARRVQGADAGYPRGARILYRLAVAVAGLMTVAFVASIVLLMMAGEDGAAYGYLALFLWFGMVAAFPVLLALGVPAVVMRRRHRERRARGVVDGSC
ncbi:hypothetical protein [Streptomyces sp. NPDC048002]|uniref:hypothetical protein n=1 Tax=Streptomyces sp. NPDC048002 TaxID=3154344 RepID=UPI003403717D